MDKIKHNLLAVITLAIGIFLILISSFSIVQSSTFWLNFFSNGGTACLALGILELMYKPFLQTELVDKIISQLKRERAIPFDQAYLRRNEIPDELHPFQLIKTAKKKIIIKAVSFTITRTQGLLHISQNALRNNKNLTLHFLLFNPESKSIDLVAKLGNVSAEGIKLDIQTFISNIKQLQEEFGDRIDYALYDSFPTCSIVLIEPDSPAGWARIEPYLYENQPTDHRMNLCLSKKQDKDYFDEIYKAIRLEWGVTRNQ